MRTLLAPGAEKMPVSGLRVRQWLAGTRTVSRAARGSSHYGSGDARDEVIVELPPRVLRREVIAMSGYSADVLTEGHTHGSATDLSKAARSSRHASRGSVYIAALVEPVGERFAHNPF